MRGNKNNFQQDARQQELHRIDNTSTKRALKMTTVVDHELLVEWNRCREFKGEDNNLTLLTRFQIIRQRGIGVRCVACVTIPTTAGVQKYLLIYLLQ
jgi:hypothetical protein